MGSTTKISWSDRTWNAVVGCTSVSPGCDHCYARGIVNRWHSKDNKGFPNPFHVVTLHPDRMDKPLRWREPSMIFVNSLSDLFHDDVPDEFIAETFAVMALAGQHVFQLLTKRHGRMRSLLNSAAFREQIKAAVLPRFAALSTRNSQRRFLELDGSGVTWPLPNLWLGVSAEDQARADLRVPALMDTPAAVRWVSAEPLLGPLDLTRWLHDSTCQLALSPEELEVLVCTCCEPLEERLDWVVAGGESGAGARPMEEGWAWSLRTQCQEVGSRFHMKQTGSVLAKAWGVPGKGDDPELWPSPGRWPREWPAQLADLGR